ncbi:Cytochrome P450, chloroplastic [Quillaja saponaria]|uniref:Cytochrome P450, chloroplastic n=1 Tax=Quillaja saponaria TaxID=32244 RepID=A0AAD7Q2G2_QUISA|nr:Cytochrome P450, chloroplastic [Quillaja saponaria]
MSTDGAASSENLLNQSSEEGLENLQHEPSKGPAEPNQPNTQQDALTQAATPVLHDLRYGSPGMASSLFPHDQAALPGCGSTLGDVISYHTNLQPELSLNSSSRSQLPPLTMTDLQDNNIPPSPNLQLGSLGQGPSAPSFEFPYSPTPKGCMKEELQFHEEYMNEQEPSILHFLLASGDDFSSKQLRDDLMTMLIAGHETTAAVLMHGPFIFFPS